MFILRNINTQTEARVLVAKRSMKHKSEEWCGNCNTTFETHHIETDCPHCYYRVISCNACTNQDNCSNCEKGSNFKD